MGEASTRDASGPTALPDPLCTRGRGLFLIYHLMDDVEVCSGGGGTVVRMWKRTLAG